MASSKLNLAILISGRGSNMQALVEACKGPLFPATVSVVLSNRPEAEGLNFARSAGIPTEVVDHKAFSDRQAFEIALQSTLLKHPVDLIALAGFMRVLTPYFIAQWPGRILNIHPSLLPEYKGLHTHERALADGKTESGCTVHYVVPELDSGPILEQRRVPILSGDTPETLAARVLEQEHIAYPQAIETVAAALKKA